MSSMRNYWQKASPDRFKAEFGHLSALIDVYVLRSTWLFDGASIRYLTEGNRKRDAKSGRCIYVMALSTKPGLLKIGCSVDLRQRNRSYISQTGLIPAFIAVAQIEQHIFFERLLHEYFFPVARKGEWFERLPVENWLETVKRVLGDG